jgi:hypothetical protein
MGEKGKRMLRMKEMAVWPEDEFRETIANLEKDHAHEQFMIKDRDKTIVRLYAKLSVEQDVRKQIEQFCLQLSEEVIRLRNKCGEQ